MEISYNFAGNPNKLSKIINVSSSELSLWYKGKIKDYSKEEMRLQFMPLSKVKLISKILVEDNNYEFEMKNIERNTLMYRTQTGNPIKNPKFPLKESPEMVRLVFHLLGDGYDGGKKDSANYKNTCPELLKEFKNDLNIFGDVPIYEQKNSIKFPRLIASIIKDFYKVNPRTFESRITNKILNIPKKWLYQGIRAFADDEGTIYKSSVRICSANFYLLDGIKKIIDYLKIKRNEIKAQFSEKATFSKIYYLDIRDIELYKKRIGFTHPKKRDKLEKYVKEKKTRRRKKLLRLKS